MVITRTPFRVSFFGGGTDYPEFYKEHGGAVLSATIDKYCYVTIRDFPPFYPYKNQFTYSKIERFNTADEVSHPLVREALKMTGENGLQIAYDADLPARTGIGSSSSFAVGLLHGICALRGKLLTPYDLAAQAIELERVRCGEAGGIQDQIAAAYGGINRIDFNSDGFSVHPLNIPDSITQTLQENLLLINTGMNRYSFQEAKEQEDNIQNNIEILCKMKQMVDKAQNILLKNDNPDKFGALLDESWKLKAMLANNISNPEIDRMYDIAKNNGAIGGKLIGAGGGGFLLVYAHRNMHQKIRDSLKEYQFVPFKFEYSGSKIIYR